MNNLNTDTALILGVQLITIGLIIGEFVTTLIFIFVSVAIFFIVINEQRKRDKIINEKIKYFEDKLTKKK